MREVLGMGAGAACVPVTWCSMDVGVWGGPLA